jgi:NAD(P)-dependent dehydrogenase (short-subunit alcohol dehydrogenase family)
VSVVVGGAGALGYPICAHLIEQGHRLLLVGADQDHARHASAKLGPQTSWLQADVRCDDDVARIGRWFRDQDHHLRMLVFLAAARPSGGIEHAKVEDIVDSVSVKVGGFLRVVRSLIGYARHGAAVVAIGGDLAYEPTAAAGSSGIANAALANCVRQLQQPLGQAGIRVHLVAPGPVGTARLTSMIDRQARTEGVEASAIHDRISAASPLNRLTSVDEIAWLVGLLADERAAGLHGATLIVDTGRRAGIP